VGGWKILHNEEFHNLYASPNIIREIKSGGETGRHVACMGELRSAYKILVGKPEGNRPLGGPKSRWVDNNIGIDLRDIRWEVVDWIHVFQDRDQ